MPGAGDRPPILAELGAIGGQAGVPDVDGAGVSGGSERMDGPGVTAAFCADNVGVLPAGGHGFGRERLPAARAEDFAVRQDAGKLRAWRAAVLRDGNADAQRGNSAGGESE